MDERDRDGGPDWPVRSAVSATPSAGTVTEALWNRGAVSWYTGATVALIWLVSPAQEIARDAASAFSAAAGIAVLIVFALAFLAAPPLMWRMAGLRRLAVPAVLFTLSFALLPWLGGDIISVWTYVGVLVGMSVLPWRIIFPTVVGLAALALAVQVVGDGFTEDDLWLPAILLSISMMMAAFARNLAAMNELRATQAQLERLAAERERGRVARDIHDILGHSLTVITVKTELAGRLVDVDPQRAKAEISEVEALARGALADVRSTVAGFRQVSVTTELAAARAALEAAGIRAELPSSTDAVAPAHRELAGWVVREGVTNVIRHSAASVCRIRLDAGALEIADDGVGPTDAAGTSTGIAGLRERVEAAGGSLRIGRSDLGGFSLGVRL